MSGHACVGVSDRKLRLFACACARLRKWGGPGHWFNVHIDAVERWADGGAPPTCHNIGNLQAMTSLVEHAADAARWAVRPSDTFHTAQNAVLLREIIGNPWHLDRAGYGKRHQGGDGKVYVFSPPWMRDPAVRSIAEIIYREQQWQEMPVLADALIDAGCRDTTLIDHCRRECEPGMGTCDYHPHVKGCWAIDLLLGKV